MLASITQELCMDAMLDVQRNPALRERVQTRLEEHRTDPDNGLSWDELKRHILSRQKIA